MQAPPSAGTRGKEPFRFGKAVLADLDDFQEKAKATEKSENAATPPPEGACSRLAAPTRVLPGTSARPAARRVGEGHAQFLFRVSTATKAACQAQSCARRWSSGSVPWPSAQRSWSTRR